MSSYPEKHDYIAISFTCPFCKRTVRGLAPKINMDETGSIAFNHGDHVVIVDYDGFGQIISIYSTRILDTPSKNKIVCPRCGREVNIPPISNQLMEFAQVHDDHVLVVYVFEGRFYITDVIDLSLSNNLSEQKSILTRLLEKISTRDLAKILVNSCILGEERIHAPRKSIKLINNLLIKLREPNTITVVPGKIDSDDEIDISYFENLLNHLQKLPETEALQKLFISLELARKVINYAVKFLENGEFNIVMDFVETLSDKDLEAFILSVIYYMIKRKTKNIKEIQT